MQVLPGQEYEIYPTSEPVLISPVGAAPQPVLAPIFSDEEGGGTGGSSNGGGVEEEGAVGGGGGGVAASELLVCRDSGSFFVGPDGKVRGQGKRGGRGGP